MRLRLAVLLAPLLLASVPASAAPHSALEDARKLTSQAMVEYNVGRFEQALDLYTKAYERLPKPALLFDLGQCHRQLGHYERALFFFHGYLREQPDAPNRALAEKLLDDSQRQLDAQRATEAADARARSEAAQAQAAAPASASIPVTSTEASSSTQAPPPAAPPSRLFRIAGFATDAAGVLLVAGGVYAGLRSASLANEISNLSAQSGTWNAHYQSDYDSGKSLATLATVLFVSGGVALATGAVLTWLGWPKGAQTTGSVAPLPGGASLGLVTRF
jgi:tetratricopeptide (TPR) repeat protein